MEEKLRMCIACREMKDKKQLVRIVKDKNEEISIDLTGKKNGRGAYICKNEDCLKKLIKTKALNRTFKTNIDENVYQSLEEIIIGK